MVVVIQDISFLFQHTLEYSPPKHNSLPIHYRRPSRPKRPAISMYSNPRHHQCYYYYYYTQNYWPSENSLYNANNYASRNNKCLQLHDILFDKKHVRDEPIYYDCDLPKKRIVEKVYGEV